MKNALTISGYNTRLRPVTLADAEFIVQLRNMPHVLGTVGDTSHQIADQRQWIESYLYRPDDYYFIVESLQGQPWGTIGTYNFKGDTAECGRFVMVPGILAALPGSVLNFRLAFEQLGLAEVRTEVVSDNAKVLSLNRRLGLHQVGVAYRSRFIQGKWIDMVQFEMSRNQWLDAYKKLHSLAEVAGRTLK